MKKILKNEKIMFDSINDLLSFISKGKVEIEKKGGLYNKFKLTLLNGYKIIFPIINEEL